MDVKRLAGGTSDLSLLWQDVKNFFGLSILPLLLPAHAVKWQVVSVEPLFERMIRKSCNLNPFFLFLFLPEAIVHCIQMLNEKRFYCKLFLCRLYGMFIFDSVFLFFLYFREKSLSAVCLKIKLSIFFF